MTAQRLQFLQFDKDFPERILYNGDMVKRWKPYKEKNKGGAYGFFNTRKGTVFLQKVFWKRGRAGEAGKNYGGRGLPRLRQSISSPTKYG